MKNPVTIFFIPTILLFGIIGCQPKRPIKPNILYIFTDQQSETMMSCAGNEYLSTPAMDYIANNGIRFTRAYTPNPVCSPARLSMMTGRMPGYFKDREGNQVRENRGAMRVAEIGEEVKNSTLPLFLKQAGYELVFGGKEHLPKPLTPETLGFIDITDDERAELSEKAAQYIRESHEKPYFMVVSLINPHDICYMAIRDFATTPRTKGLVERGIKEIATLDEALKLPEGVDSARFFKEFCPPLPPNYEPQEDEAKAIGSLLDQRPFRRNARENYTDEQWRMHRWAYARLTEKVDAQIQVILDALKESGQEENTLVILSSDHGDNDSSHKLEHKTVMYEESTNIPFLVMWKGQIPPGKVNEKNLISSGLDLLPTLCDYANVEGVADPRGLSLRPLLEGKEVAWRKTLGVEGEISRMIVSEDGYKYVRYDAVGFEERLMDLNSDPFEKTHVTNNSGYTATLDRMRIDFDEQWFPGLDK